MKKPILYSILISLLLIGGAYYYFFMMEPIEELNVPPARVKLPMPQQAVQEAKKEEVKKEEPKKEVKKEEKKEEKKIETKEIQKPEKKVEAKAEAKPEIKKESKEAIAPEKKEEKKPRYFIIEAKYMTAEEAEGVKNELLGLGYHTAKVVKKGSSSFVILSPFTDYYEADFVRKGIEADTKRKEFKTRAVY